VASVAHWDEVEREREEQGPLASWTTDLGTTAGSVTVGVTRCQIDPGKCSTPAHVELAEEEISFVLGGSGLSWQFDGERVATYEVGLGDCLVHLACEEAHTLRAGPDGLDVLAFGQRAYPGGTWLPRAGVVREAGGDGLTYLAYGTREPNDIAYYPRSNKIYWRGVGVMARVEKLDYWDGEA
jgi:uncharacterized cupin superfamily protein